MQKCYLLKLFQECSRAGRREKDKGKHGRGDSKYDIFDTFCKELL
jgi:hypothetical protein